MLSHGKGGAEPNPMSVWSMAGAGQNGGSAAGGRFRPGKWTWRLIFIGAAAFISMTPIGHVLAIISMISVIGIPIYFLLAALPAIFLILLFLRCVVGALDNYKAGATALAVAFGAGALFMVDYFVLRAQRANAVLDARAQALIADDIAGPARIPAGRIIATVRSESYARAQLDNVCDDLCQRLLLNGFAERVLAITIAPQVDKRAPRGAVPELAALAPDKAMAGVMYWLEKRASCPDAKVPDSVRLLRVDAPVKGAGRMNTRTASESMRVKIASGTCLMSEPARLDQADGAFFYGEVARGGGRAYGFDIQRNTVGAWRTAYYRRAGAEWTAEHRETGVRYQRFPGVLIPSYIHGAELRIYNGFLRTDRYLGGRERYEDSAPVAETLMQLGVNLSIDDAGQSDGPKVVDEILAYRGAIQPLQAAIIEDYLGRTSANRSRRLEPDDVRRVLALAADDRIPFTWNAQGAVTMVAEQQPQLAAELARRMFARLDAIVASASVVSEQASRSASAISRALAALPATALKPYFTNIEAVAFSPVLRPSAQDLIARLDVFGSFAVPTMFKVIDESLGERGPGRSNWRNGVTAGLRALCRLGGEGAFARPMLEERIRGQGEFFVNANDRLVVATLVRMGAGETEIRELLGFDEKKENRLRNALRAANGERACG